VAATRGRRSTESAGLRLLRQVPPLDAAGKPSPSGKIVLLASASSNTIQAFNGFSSWLPPEAPTVNPQLVLVTAPWAECRPPGFQNPDDGATGTKYWKFDRREKLATYRVTREQVQVVWIKETDAGPYAAGFSAHTSRRCKANLRKVVQVVPQRIFRT